MSQISNQKSFKTLAGRFIQSLGLTVLTLISLQLWPTLALAQNPISLQLNPPEGNSVTKLIPDYEIKPTKTVEDILTVSNTSRTTTYKFRVYPVDSIQSSDGTGAYKLAEAEQKAAGTWIKFNNQKEISIRPEQTLFLPYRITIPAKATPGIFKGGLVVEIQESENSSANANQQVKVVTRLVEPVIISVPGRKIANYNIDDFSYQQKNGYPSFHFQFSNQGNMLLQTDANIRVSGTLLQEPYKIALNNAIILQDSQFEKTFTFENPPLFGSYQAELELNVYEYDILKDQFKPLKTIHQKINFNIVPYGCIIALILLIILAILAERWRRKYLHEAALNTFIHRVTRGENITSIGSLYKINWRTIAKLNKLSKPYALEPGDELILPFPKLKKNPVKPKSAESLAPHQES